MLSPRCLFNWPQNELRATHPHAHRATVLKSKLSLARTTAQTTALYPGKLIPANLTDHVKSAACRTPTPPGALLEPPLPKNPLAATSTTVSQTWTLPRNKSEFSPSTAQQTAQLHGHSSAARGGGGGGASGHGPYRRPAKGGGGGGTLGHDPYRRLAGGGWSRASAKRSLHVPPGLLTRR